MRTATYRMIYFPKVGRYVAMAWNYEQAILIATEDCGDYTEARGSLQDLADARGVTLRWFDGSYTCDGETLDAVEAEHHPPRFLSAALSGSSFLDPDFKRN